MSLTFHCNSCESERDFHRDYGVLIISAKKEVKRYCRICRSPKALVPDVFWDGKPEENLADGADGRPRVFGSKGEKAAYLASRGIQEAGDRYHGAPIEYSKSQGSKVDSKHEVQMALKKVKDMGEFRRHQEYLKIIKEGQRHA